MILSNRGIILRLLFFIGLLRKISSSGSRKPAAELNKIKPKHRIYFITCNK
jgi:hypothetical protein